MKRRFRLTNSTDFKRVRRLGKSYAHPLIVLIALPNEQEQARFAVAAGRAVGNAVVRNQAKRWLRAALHPLLPRITPGWDVLLLARRPLPEAGFHQCREALYGLLSRAHLLKASDGD